LFLDNKDDLFELVEIYFKICKKYQGPTLEELYYFLTEEQQLEVKLEGDMLKRTGKYNDLKSTFQFWRPLHEQSAQKTLRIPKTRSKRLFPLQNNETLK